MCSTEDRLVRQHIPLVRRLALQLVARLPSSVELDDLLQAGMMGLLDALRRDQRMPQAQFETYAVRRIRGSMLDELRCQDWLPRSVRSKARDIEQAMAALHQQLGRAPTEQETANALGLSLQDYRAMLEDACGVQIIHYEDMGRSQEAADAAPEPAHGHGQETPLWADNPLQCLMSKGLRKALVDAIERLPERERQLLALQFEHDLSQKEIAAVLGVTEGRVSQLRSQAVIRIRAALAGGSWHESPGEYMLHALP
jgi:RNA polymerase sigma factor for flagellar operon FliA